MRICLPRMNGGKGNFYLRLERFLRKIGVSVTNNIKDRYDIILLSRDFHLFNTLDKKKKIVLRLDGFAITGSSKYMPIIKKRASGIVYQTEFTKKIFDKYVNKFKTQKKTIIFNGADPLYYSSIKPLKANRNNVYITFGNWKPSQRLEDIIESFILADIDNSVLYVVGNTSKSGVNKKKYSNYDNIFFTGQINHKKLVSYIKAAKASIHLRWCDWCPNGVVESICCGTPVITNNVSGTKEIIELCGGIVCNIDPPLTIMPKKTKAAPKIDRKVVASAIKECTNININTKYVDIRKIAKKYKLFFEQIIG